MTLGERIQYFRKRAGLSQEGLAERLGVSRQAVSKWETDEALPDAERIISYTLIKLARGKAKEVPVLMYILSALFILSYILLATTAA